MIMQVIPINIYLKDAKLTYKATFDEIDQLKGEEQFRGKEQFNEPEVSSRIAYKNIYT